MGNEGNVDLKALLRRERLKLCYKAKSWTAVVLSAALVLTSVDGITVRAAQLEDAATPVEEEKKPETGVLPDVPEKPPYLTNEEGAVIISSFQALPEEESRIELKERKTLEEVRALMPETLKADVTPYPLADPDNGQAGEEEPKPDEGDTDPGEEEEPGEGDTDPGREEPGEGDSDPGREEPGEGDTEPGREEPGEGDNEPGKEEPGEGDSEPGKEEPGEEGGNSGGEKPGEEDSGPGEDGQPEGGNGVEEEPERQDDAASADDAAFAARGAAFSEDGNRWRFFAETGEGGSGPAGGEAGSGSDGGQENGSEEEAGSGSGEAQGGTREEDTSGNEDGAGESPGGSQDNAGESPDGGEDNAGENTDGSGDNAGENTGGSGDGAGDNAGESTGGSGDSAGDGTGESTGGSQDGAGDGVGGSEDGAGESTGGNGEGETPPESGTDGEQPAAVEVEVPVSWACENYDAEEADTYTFIPEWDEEAWFFEESGTHKLPVIEVVYTAGGPVPEVSTEEELAAAFAAGFEQITLKNDISLTAPLRLPADADIELDGGGYRLARGTLADAEEESGGAETFSGIMIAMDGEDYTEDAYGTLTLKDLTVDGGTEEERAGAPVILDRGKLVLDEGAAVTGNFNYGTYPEEEDGETVPDYGGGIQVYGELAVSPEALITGNFADEFGGGVYLGEGAALYLYADVLVENRVGEGHGYGADLYAASGSTVYYDPSIDMGREGFYICEGAYLVPMGIMEAGSGPVDDRREVYISVARDSGYDEEQVAALKAGLAELGYTIISDRRTDIDATDLRDWYVYDHYDTDANCWGAGTADNPPAAWTEAYQGSGDKRKYYPYSETLCYTGADQVYTVKDWIEAIGDPGNPKYENYIEWELYQGEDGEEVKRKKRILAKFKEHIYSGAGSEGAMMTFAGYGITPNIDFLYYDPESDGEKVVDFDVDSSQIDTHTLNGNGFLVNTGVEGGKLYGYLVLYKYKSITKNVMLTPTYVYPLEVGITGGSVSLYQLKGVPVDAFHNGTAYLGSAAAPLAGSKEIDADGWDNMMSIQIKVSPDKIEVRQQPKASAEDISRSTPFYTYDIKGSGQGENEKTYSGFGPLVAYGSHGCSSATTFTYSNLRMYYTNPELEKEDMLSPLERADFTQEGTQKYFINLFGDSGLAYNETADFGQYQEYMKMMQNEGVALITDRKTPFGPYLGEADDPDSNLVELPDGGRLSVDSLIQKIQEGISGKTNTRLDHKLDLPPGAGGVKRPEPKQSVGNIWLRSTADGGQIREPLQGDQFGNGGYGIQIMDDLTYYHGNQPDLTVTYEVLKPGRNGYTTLCIVNGADAVSYSMGETDDGIRITPPPFTVTGNAGEWPAGSYTVRQTINNSSVHGYAYFDLEQADTPVEPVPDTYPVKVRVAVRKDEEAWTDHGRKFVLQPENGGALVDPDLWTVPAGSYVIYDVTDQAAGVSTGVTVSVTNAGTPNTEVETPPVDYYTVTFYDGDTAYPGAETVLKGQKAARPEDPSKPGCEFREWVTQDKGSDAYDFDAAVTDKTDIYARWAYPVTVSVKVRIDAIDQTSHGRKFMLQPESGEPLAEPFEAVPAGDYAVYDVTGLEEGGALTPDRNTGISVTVTEEDTENPDITDHPKEVTVEYNTVSFYDENTQDKKLCESGGEPNPQIILKGRCARQPGFTPAKDKRRFAGWVNEEGTEFDFGSNINKKTEVYAKWHYPATVQVTATRDGSKWTGHGKTYMLLPENGGALAGLTEVPEGKYTVCEADELAEDGSLKAGVDTGIPVEAVYDDLPNRIEVEVSYYTVTFYDAFPDGERYGDDTGQAQQTVLKGAKASAPAVPQKDKYSFTGWVADDGTAEGKPFELEGTEINGPVKLYAAWERVEEPRYKVTVGARKDGGEWKGAGRAYALRPESGDGETVFDLAQVKNGTYRIYDITGGLSASRGPRAVETDAGVEVDDGDTGVIITVENADAAASVDYYTVTFYDGESAYGTDTPQSPVVVLKGKKAGEAPAPEKKGYRFTGWKTGEEGSTAFDFDQAVSRKTGIYAGWERIVYTIDAEAGKGGRISPSGRVTVNAGEQQTFAVTPERGYHVKAVTVDETDVTSLVAKAKGFYTFLDVNENHTIRAAFAADKSAPEKSRKSGEDGGGTVQTIEAVQEAPPAESVRAERSQAPEERPYAQGEPKTGDAAPVEICATVAMISGLGYLMLYFMDDSRGMSEREKEVFVAAFIRWAKKGGRFRRYCAVIAIFCILVYYHSIGKRLNRKNANRGEWLLLWK